jgi:single-strand DNA-binding protein
MEVKGKLIVKGQTIAVNEKFSKRHFVVKTDGQHSQDIEFQLTQDKCSLLDSVNLDDEINVAINLRGRAWTAPTGEVKYFNTLEAWKIDVLVQSPQLQAPIEPIREVINDGLPF